MNHPAHLDTDRIGLPLIADLVSDLGEYTGRVAPGEHGN